MGKFVVTVRKNGEFQFNLKATNGQVILTSEGYNTKAACLNGIESVKKNGPVAARYAASRITPEKSKQQDNITGLLG